MPIAYGEPGAAAFRRLGYVRLRSPLVSHVDPQGSLRVGDDARRQQFAGTEVRVMPPIPRAEGPAWSPECDSEWLWPVHPEDAARFGCPPDFRMCLCIHQVDVD